MNVHFMMKNPENIHPGYLPYMFYPGQARLQNLLHADGGLSCMQLSGRRRMGTSFACLNGR